jgi:hypothetical protein
VTYGARIPGVTDTKAHEGQLSVRHSDGSHSFARMDSWPVPPQTLVGMSIVLRVLARRTSAFGGICTATLMQQLKP